jgi:hypothetical protein
MSDAAGRNPSMQLIAQEYGEILAALKAAADSKGSERRQLARLEVQAQVKCVPYNEGQLGTPFTCLTRDLSFKGVGLFQARQAARGSQFVVVLPRRQDSEAVSILCTVMYCRTLADGLFNVGASFVKPFDLRAPQPTQPRTANAPAPAPNAKPAAAATAKADAELNRIRQSILG